MTESGGAMRSGEQVMQQVLRRGLGILLALTIQACAAEQSEPATGTGLNRGQVRLKLSADQPAQVLYSRSHALLISMNNYHNGWVPLENPGEDVEAVAAAIKPQFDSVEVKSDLTGEELRQTLKDFIFGPGREPNSRLLIYFAGHGASLDDTGYLVPVDAPYPDTDPLGFEKTALNLWDIDSDMRKIKAKHVLFLFDSCFSGKVLGLGRGAPPPDEIRLATKDPVRQFITAGSASETVPDKSLFREFVVRGLGGEADRNQDGYVTASELGGYLENKILEYSKNHQHPQYGKMKDTKFDKGDVVFIVGSGAKVVVNGDTGTEGTGKRLDRQIELAYWNGISGSCDPQAFAAYRSKYPQGEFLVPARIREAECGTLKATPGPAPAPPPEVKPSPPPNEAEQKRMAADEAEARRQRELQYQQAVTTFSAGVVFRDCDICPDMVVIPESAYSIRDVDVHDSGQKEVFGKVNCFALSQQEITYSLMVTSGSQSGNEFCRILKGDRPGYATIEQIRRDFSVTDVDPAFCVSVEHAQKFISWLSKRTNQAYRLPSSGEWLWAASAEKAEDDSNIELYANCFNCQGGSVRGRFSPASPHKNIYNISDLYGNMTELVVSSDQQLVRLGGSYLSKLEELKEPYIAKFVDKKDRHITSGLRVVRNVTCSK